MKLMALILPGFWETYSDLWSLQGTKRMWTCSISGQFEFAVFMAKRSILSATFAWNMEIYDVFCGIARRRRIFLEFLIFLGTFSTLQNRMSIAHPLCPSPASHSYIREFYIYEGFKLTYHYFQDWEARFTFQKPDEAYNDVNNQYECMKEEVSQGL